MIFFYAFEVEKLYIVKLYISTRLTINCYIFYKYCYKVLLLLHAIYIYKYIFFCPFTFNNLYTEKSKS